MDENNKIQLFQDKRIRMAWNEEQEEWYFSIVDVVDVLSEQPEQPLTLQFKPSNLPPDLVERLMQEAKLDRMRRRAEREAQLKKSE